MKAYRVKVDSEEEVRFTAREAVNGKPVELCVHQVDDQTYSKCPMPIKDVYTYYYGATPAKSVYICVCKLYTGSCEGSPGTVLITDMEEFEVER